MRKYRKMLILVVLLAASLGAGIYWLWPRPPQVTRLLPDGDRLLYLDLRALRLFDWNNSKPLKLEPDYQQFVDQTGIHFEHDLKQAAIVWRDTPGGPNTESAAVFVARFDPVKLRSYLQGISSRTDIYHNRTIYFVDHEGRTVRVSILDDDQVIAVTNMPDQNAMPGIIERWEHSARGPELLTQYYGRIPAGSLAWLIDRFPSGAGEAQLPDGLSFSFLENKVAIVSARYNGQLLLRADVLAADEPEARRMVDSASNFLSLYRSISKSVARGTDRDVKAALDSIRVQQKGSEAVFSASLSENFLKKIVQETQTQITPPTASPLPSPSPIPGKNRQPASTTSHR